MRRLWLWFRQTDIIRQTEFFFVLHCYRVLPSDGLITPHLQDNFYPKLYELWTRNFERIFTSFHVSHVTCQMLCITCHESHVTYHVSHVTCHVSHVIYHMYFFYHCLYPSRIVHFKILPESVWITSISKSQQNSVI